MRRRYSSGKYKIFSYDDVAGTLRQVTNLNATNDLNTVGTPADPQFVVYSGRLYFRAINAAGFAKLFAYDDNANELIQVTDIRPGANDFTWASTVLPTVYVNRLAFAALDPAGVEKVFSLCDLGAGCTP